MVEDKLLGMIPTIIGIGLVKKTAEITGLYKKKKKKKGMLKI